MNIKEIMTKEEYNQLIMSFRKFIKSPENQPFKCKTYGTKCDGNVAHIHYALYAILRGKSPESTTHDSGSDTFKDVMKNIERLALGGGVYQSDSLESAFGLSEDRIVEILNQ